MATPKADLVRLIKHVGKDITWYQACLDGLWLNEHEHVRDRSGDREKVTRTKFASSAVARRAYRAAIRTRETDDFVVRCDIETPGWAINGKGQRAYWNVPLTKTGFGRGTTWGDDVEIVIVDTTKPVKAKAAAKTKPPSRRRRS